MRRDGWVRGIGLARSATCEQTNAIASWPSRRCPGGRSQCPAHACRTRSGAYAESLRPRPAWPRDRSNVSSGESDRRRVDHRKCPARSRCRQSARGDFAAHDVESARPLSRREPLYDRYGNLGVVSRLGRPPPASLRRSWVLVRRRPADRRGAARRGRRASRRCRGTRRRRGGWSWRPRGSERARRSG